MTKRKPAGPKQREFRQFLKRFRENRPQWLKDLHDEAKAKGLDKLTMREINKIVAQVRREKDRLYGQTHRISAILSERMYRELKAAAEAQGWNVTQAVRQAIGDYLKRGTQPASLQKASEEAKSVTKAISESTREFRTGRYED